VTAAPLRLGVNVDHIATLRNARGGIVPDPVRAAHMAAGAGAENVTAHLREDRRHITDDDIARLRTEVSLPLNMEMAATPEMRDIARNHRPHAACLVPERRTERTTEGGLDAAGDDGRLAEAVAALTEVGTRVSLFIEPEPRHLEAARAMGAPAVELHTGRFCDTEGDEQAHELARLTTAAARAAELGLECHAGHGLTYATVPPVARIPQIVELNIGHFLVAEGVFMGLDETVRHMRAVMDAARGETTEDKA